MANFAIQEILAPTKKEHKSLSPLTLQALMKIPLNLMLMPQCGLQLVMLPSILKTGR